MKWPLPFPAKMSDGVVSIRPYRHTDAEELFGALADEQRGNTSPGRFPQKPTDLHEMIASKLADGRSRDVHYPRDHLHRHSPALASS